MKYVFPTQEARWDAKLYEKFGRAPGFAVYDDESDTLIYIENTEMNAGHGAGIQAGQTVVNTGASVVAASGSVGPKAMQILEKAGIKVHADLGHLSLKEALDKIRG